MTIFMFICSLIHFFFSSKYVLEKVQNHLQQEMKLLFKFIDNLRGQFYLFYTIYLYKWFDKQSYSFLNELRLLRATIKKKTWLTIQEEERLMLKQCREPTRDHKERISFTPQMVKHSPSQCNGSITTIAVTKRTLTLSFFFALF